MRTARTPPGPAEQHCLEARLLGGLALRYDGRPLSEAAFHRRKGLLLLLRLLAVPGHRLPIEVILEWLWPERDPTVSAHRLRTVLSDVRAALPDHAAPHPLLRLDAALALDPALDVALDIDGFAAAAATGLADGDAAALRRALMLYTGPLLPSLPYEDWVLERRAALARLHRQVVLALAAQGEAAAEEPLRSLLGEDPADEEVGQTLMRLLGARGQRAEALRIHHALVSVLRNELGVDPGPETVAVHAALLEPPASQGLGGAARPAPGTPVWPHGGYLGALPTSALVAREAEVARIRDTLATVGGGTGRLLLLAGEPGVGKTRLAQEATQAARERGLCVLVGRCYEQYATVPFSPFVQILTMALDAASPALRQAAGQRFAELGRVVPDAVPPPPALEGEDGGLRVQRAIAGFLRALAAEAPLALLTDDLHWADGASVELLGYLARELRGAPVLLLGAYRDVEVDRSHPLHALLTALTRERLVEHLALRGLPPEGTAALIRAHFGVAAVSDELRDLVHGRAEGNPFFTEEVLAALVEQGAIYRQGAGWERKALVEMVVPESVKAVVGQRVGRLGPGAYETLRLASVLGQAFELQALLGAAEQPEGEVLDHLEAALGARLLEERREGRGERYAFAHALIGQALYDELPRFRLRRLHLRAGEALERARGGRPAGAAELARHFLAAGELERGARHALTAGDHAMELYAHAEAAGHYRAALGALGALEEQADEAGAAGARLRLGEALVALHRLEEAEGALAAALAAYERLGDRRRQARAQAALGSLRARQEDAAGAWAHFEAALALWPVGYDTTGQARMLLRAAGVKVYAGDAEAAEVLAGRGMALAEELSDPALQAEALVTGALVQDLRPGGTARAIALLRRAEPLALRANALQTLVRLYNNLGATLLSAGDVQAAAASLRTCIAVGEQAELPGPTAHGYAVLAYALLELGTWDEGRAAARRAAELGAVYGHDDQERWMAGEPERALAALREWLATAQRQNNVEQDLYNGYRLADWCIQVGRIDEAEATARDRAALLHAHGFWDATGMVLGSLAEAAVRAGAADAPTVVADAEALVAREGHHLAMAQVLRARGLLLAGQGEAEAALAALTESAQIARERGALVQLARTLHTLAEVARSAGDEVAAQSEVERAAIVRAIGPETRGLTWAQGLW